MLELIHESGGPRYYLDGQPIHAGDVLEVWRDGAWHCVRFEWCHLQEITPVLYYSDDRGWLMRDDELMRWAG